MLGSHPTEVEGSCYYTNPQDLVISQLGFLMHLDVNEQNEEERPKHLPHEVRENPIKSFRRDVRRGRLVEDEPRYESSEEDACHLRGPIDT